MVFLFPSFLYLNLWQTNFQVVCWLEAGDVPPLGLPKVQVGQLGHAQHELAARAKLDSESGLVRSGQPPPLGLSSHSPPRHIGKESGPGSRRHSDFRVTRPGLTAASLTPASRPGLRRPGSIRVRPGGAARRCGGPLAACQGGNDLCQAEPGLGLPRT